MHSTWPSHFNTSPSNKVYTLLIYLCVLYLKSIKFQCGLLLEHSVITDHSNKVHINFLIYDFHVFILQETNFKEPLRIFSETELDSFNLHYYSAEVHRAAFVLPRFAKKALDEIINSVTDEVNTGDR